MLLRSCFALCLFLLPGAALAIGDAPRPSADVPPAPPAAPAVAADHPATDAGYKPPFPDREELFQPPNVSRPVSQRQDAAEVALKGFVDLGQPQVVLAVNGRIKQLGAGESAAGVEVIRIDPPKVTLQRGRVRWTETLFELRTSVPPTPLAENGPAHESLSGESQRTSDSAPPDATTPAEPEPDATVGTKPQEVDATAPVAQPKVMQPGVDQPAIEPTSDEPLPRSPLTPRP